MELGQQPEDLSQRTRRAAGTGKFAQMDARMRELALGTFGCLDFHAVTEGVHEVALSYWPDEASIRAWKAHPEHVLAQSAGRDRWYASYTVEVAEVTRAYRAGT